MVQIFDDWRDEGERVVHKNISGPTDDGAYEIGGHLYQYEPLTPEQNKALEKHVNDTIERGRCFYIDGKKYYYR